MLKTCLFLIGLLLSFNQIKTAEFGQPLSEMRMADLLAALHAKNTPSPRESGLGTGASPAPQNQLAPCLQPSVSPKQASEEGSDDNEAGDFVEIPRPNGHQSTVTLVSSTINDEPIEEYQQPTATLVPPRIKEGLDLLKRRRIYTLTIIKRPNDKCPASRKAQQNYGATNADTSDPCDWEKIPTITAIQLQVAQLKQSLTNGGTANYAAGFLGAAATSVATLFMANPLAIASGAAATWFSAAEVKKYLMEHNVPDGMTVLEYLKMRAHKKIPRRVTDGP